MKEARLFSLFGELWQDVRFVEFYWVLAGLLAVLGLAWLLTLRLRRRTTPGTATGAPGRGLAAFGAGGLKRVAFPLVALALVVVLRRVLEDLEVPHLSLLALAAPLLTCWALARLLVYLLRCVMPNGEWLSRFERWLSFAIWGAVVLHLSGLAQPLIAALEHVSFGVGKQEFNLWLLINGLLTVSATLLLALWLASLIENRLLAASSLDGNLREVLARVAKALLTLVALLGSLSLVGIDVTALSVFSGALAVGLGFGLQKIASNYVSGFIILLDRSIRLGNLVAVDDKTTGTVSQITTRYTVIRMLSGTDVIVPNEYLVNNIVRNLSFADTRVRVALAVQVGYDTDLDLAMRLMVDAAREQPRVLADPEPGALLLDFADSGINLEVGFWVADPENGTGGVRSDIGRAILQAFRTHGIEIPFPQRELRVRPPATVELPRP